MIPWGDVAILFAVLGFIALLGVVVVVAVMVWWPRP